MRSIEILVHLVGPVVKHKPFHCCGALALRRRAVRLETMTQRHPHSMTHKAHEKMHHEIAEAQQKGIKHENHENFHTVAGIYNSVGRYLCRKRANHGLIA